MLKKLILAEYEARFITRMPGSYRDENKCTALGKSIVRSPKFAPGGRVIPYYGLTTIAWIGTGTDLFSKLLDLRHNLEARLHSQGLSEFFSFLVPDSYHMTVCDIDPSPRYNRQKRPNTRITADQFYSRWEQMNNAFKEIAAAGPIKVTAAVRGIGLKSTITALVKFDGPDELRKVYHMESIIKKHTATDVRNYSGHISLAYFCNDPGYEAMQAIAQTLQAEAQELGPLHINGFDYTYFRDMNHFIPLLRINTVDGTITSFPENLRDIESELD